MTFSDTAMMELGITQSTNIHNTRSLIRTLKYVLDILQTEEAFTVEEYKHTHTYSKFTGEHPCRSVISIKLQGNFIEIALRLWCSRVNLVHIFRTLFPRNTTGWLLLLFTKTKLSPIKKWLTELINSYYRYIVEKSRGIKPKNFGVNFEKTDI